MIDGLPVYLRDSLTAFSTASAPLLARMVFLLNVPGVTSFRSSASRTYGSYVVTSAQGWMYFAACW